MIHIDDRIFRLQSQGGISHLWRNVKPYLESKPNGSTDTFISTYYAPTPPGYKSVVMAYDFIAERYPPIGVHHADAIAKRNAIANADKVISISAWTANDVQAFCNRRSGVAYCGTDLQRAQPIEVATFNALHKIDRPYVLVVGRRHLYKNVQALYQAWQFFSGQNDFMILCTGGEPPNIADQTFAMQYPAQWRQVRLSDSEMAAAYTGAAMLVYPTMYEGFGLPVLEAMACGTPVVCGERGAIPEIADGIPYYADVFRPISIASAMNEALNADIDRQMTGMQRAKLYTWERMADRILEEIS